MHRPIEILLHGQLSWGQGQDQGGVGEAIAKAVGAGWQHGIVAAVRLPLLDELLWRQYYRQQIVSPIGCFKLLNSVGDQSSVGLRVNGLGQRQRNGTGMKGRPS